MKIRFTESRWLDTEDRTKTPKFKKGSTHDLSEASAYRWVRRSVAVYVVEEPTLKVGRPMMGGAMEKAFSAVAKTDKPKKVGRPKKTKGDATTKEINVSPALPVTGSGKNGGPGWDDA